MSAGVVSSPWPASPSRVSFSSSGGRRLVGDRLEPSGERVGDDPLAQGQVVDQDERLIVPVLGVHGPAQKGTDGPPLFDLRTRGGLAGVGLGVKDLLHLFARVRQLDRLAAVNLLDLLAGDGVERLDPTFVHHGHLADRFIRRAGAGRIDRVGPPRG